MDVTYQNGDLTGETRKTLVVEDDARAANLLRRALEKRGHAVRVAATGDEGWQAFEEELYPLLILDWSLPGALDGVELCRRVRQTPRSRYTTILMITGHADPADQEKALEAGVDDYLTKPFSMRLLNVRLAVAEERVRDRLARELADAQRLTTEETFRHLMQRFPDFVFTVGRDGRFEFVNDAVRELGYEPSELIGEHFSLLFEPEELERISRSRVLPELVGEVTGDKKAPKLFDERRTGQRATTGLEVSLRGRGGAQKRGQIRRIGEVTACGVYDDTTSDPRRQHVGTVGIIRDTTERVEARARLEEQLHFRQTLFAAIPEPLFVKDLEGRYLDCNDAFCTFLGRERGAILGRTVFDVAPADKARVYDEHDRRLLESGGVEHYEMTVDSAAGERIVEFHKAVFRNLQGEPQGIIGTIYDITARKKAEAGMVRSERLAAVGTLASGIAHEFNNLNVGILGYAELLREDASLSEDARRRAETIYGAALRGRGVTRKLLSFARSGSSEKHSTDLNEVIRNTLELMERSLELEGIEVVMDLAPLPPVCLNDGEIGQVILNLFINAQHALLGCAEKRITVATRPEGEGVCAEVRDTGCGIPPEQLNEIFSPFFSRKGEHSGGDTAQARVRGTGLGLSVSDAIVRDHGGRLEVESQPGAGSTFTLHLPRGSGGVFTAGTAREAGEGYRGSGRILVLDDEEAVLRLLHEVLSRAGFEVVCTTDGYAALERLEREVFRAFLMDLKMPAIDGVEILSRLDGLEPAARPAVVVITGAEAGLVPAELEPIISTRLEKPFTRNEVLARLREALGPSPEPETETA